MVVGVLTRKKWTGQCDDAEMAKAIEHSLRVGPKVEGHRGGGVHVLHGGENVRLWRTDAYLNRMSVHNEIFREHERKIAKGDPDKSVDVQRLFTVRNALKPFVLPSEMYTLIAKRLAPRHLQPKFAPEIISPLHERLVDVIVEECGARTESTDENEWL
jgi:hypothetical protein